MCPIETCEDDEKQCNDGSCIRADYVCDGFDDCPDGEDEPRDDCRGERSPRPKMELLAILLSYFLCSNLSIPV